MPDIKKILVIRLSSFGDIVLSFPLIKKLKEIFPGSEIHFLTKNNYKEVAELNPNLNKIISYEGSLMNTRKTIKKEHYDLIIDIHKNFRSIIVSFLNALRVKRYKKENFKKFILVKFKLNLFKEVIPVYKKYMLTVRKFINESGTEYSNTELVFNRERIYKDDYVLVSPSSRHFTKTFPVIKFITYINTQTNRRFIITGDGSETDMIICRLIEANCSNVINLCEKLSINELANVIFYSDFVICNDSAILHLAEALGKKAVAIFGSTVKEFGFFPQLKHSKVLEINNLKCRPCTHIGRESCPEGHFNCMEKIQLIVDS